MVKFIADISSNHCGSIELAKELINEAQKAGADYAKFQHWHTDKFINKDRFNNYKVSHQKEWSQTVYQTYEKYQIPDSWVSELYEECQKAGIEFLLSCYEISKIDDFDQYVNAWKIGSGDIDYIPMLQKIASKGKPVFLGCGAATEEEVQKARNNLYMSNNDIILMQCNTNYTSDNENYKYLNLSWIDGDWVKGYSDHTKDIEPIIIAVARGAKYIERHFKISDNDSPDSKFSLNPAEWSEMVTKVNKAYSMLGDGKKVIEKNEEETRIIQRRSKTDWMRPDNYNEHYWSNIIE